MSNKLKPGQNVPRSGQYGLYGPRGGYTGREVTCVRNEVLPPTPKPNMYYQLNDPTKHKGNH